VDKFQIFFARFKPFDCQKSFANVVRGKYLDEVFSLAFMSLNGHSFKNFIFQEVLLRLVEKTKQKYV
jgi:hypothetical protein